MVVAQAVAAQAAVAKAAVAQAAVVEQHQLIPSYTSLNTLMLNLLQIQPRHMEILNTLRYITLIQKL